MSDILQTQLPYDLASQRPLPGIAPLDLADWIHVDEAFAAQMQTRQTLIAKARDKVIALTDEGTAAAAELLDLVLLQLSQRQDYQFAGDKVTRPDGVEVAVDRLDPLGTLGILVQEDLCIMKRQGDEHVLVGAVLCFPSSWTLAQKLGRPLLAIHVPVEEYDDNIGKRVQRLFDGVRPGRPLWRFNILWYPVATLFHPRREFDRRPPEPPETAAFLRTERQGIVRLPETDAVVFSIHTFVLEGDLARRMIAGET